MVLGRLINVLANDLIYVWFGDDIMWYSIVLTANFLTNPVYYALRNPRWRLAQESFRDSSWNFFSEFAVFWTSSCVIYWKIDEFISSFTRISYLWLSGRV